MYVHPNCEFKTGDLVRLFWDNNEESKCPEGYGLFVFLDNERPPDLPHAPMDYEGGPRFYRLYTLVPAANPAGNNVRFYEIEYYDRPYWDIRKP